MNGNDSPAGGLLAVDLGIRTGLAFYGADGRLRWYRSKNFGNTARLRNGVRSLLADMPDLACLVLEGGGNLADIWWAEAERLSIPVLQLSAQEWRARLFYPRQWRTAALAKENADAMARRVIDWANAPRPTSLRHDAAEAILVGLWAVLKLGWLAKLPPEIKR